MSKRTRDFSVSTTPESPRKRKKTATIGQPEDPDVIFCANILLNLSQGRLSNQSFVVEEPEFVQNELREPHQRLEDMPSFGLFAQMKLPPDHLPEGKEIKPFNQDFYEPQYRNISAIEMTYASQAGIKPDQYQMVRYALFEMYHRVVKFDNKGQSIPQIPKKWNIAKAQTVRLCDVNKIGKIFDWYKNNGLWDKDWRRPAG